MFQGGAGYASQNWLTLPKGTTTERFPSFGGVQVGTRGVFAGAYSPTRSNVIEYITIPTTGNTTDFGNLNNANGGMAGFSDNTRGWADWWKYCSDSHKCHGICDHIINRKCN